MDSLSALPLSAILGLSAAYLIGSLNPAYLWVKFRHKADLRTLGSGSLGARNAGRILGVPGFVAVLIIDFGKGVLAVVLAAALTHNPAIICLSAPCVVAGHNWPIFLGFRGGRGVATSLGAFLGLEPLLIPLVGILTVFFYTFFRRLTISGICAFCLLPIVYYLFQNEFDFSYFSLVSISGCCLIVLWGHSSHIKTAILAFREKLHGKQQNS